MTTTPPVPLSSERIQQIQARVDAATEGPWNHHDFGYAGEQEPSSIVVHRGDFDWESIRNGEGIAFLGWDSQEDENAEFIAHARSDIPALLSEVERLTAELAAEQRRADSFKASWQEVLRGTPVPAPVVADPDTEAKPECIECGHSPGYHAGSAGRPNRCRHFDCECEGIR